MFEEILTPQNFEEAKEVYHTVMDINPDGIFIYDLDGNLVDCNEGACKIHGFTKEEMLSMKPKDFVHPEGYQTFLDFMSELEKSGTFHGESCGITKDKRKFEVEVYGKMMTIKGKKFLYSTIKDITKVKQHEKDLEAAVAERTKELEEAYENLKKTQTRLLAQERLASLGTLISGLAHELKNPLSIAINASAALLGFVEDKKQEMEKGINNRKPEEIEEARILAEMAHKNVQRADAIIQNVLSQIRPGKSISVKTNLKELIEETVRISLYPLRGTFNFDFVADLDDIGEFTVYPNELSRVLVNLMENSIYALKKRTESASNDYRPRLKLTLKRENNWAVVRVSDNGVGIPDSKKEKVFDQFYTTKPPGEGTGIGLSLVHDIITKLHAGEVKVESEEGEGTEFVVRLPVGKV